MEKALSQLKTIFPGDYAKVKAIAEIVRAASIWFMFRVRLII
jgi:hypothetical protein